jgi:hypothetical protein
LLILIAHSQVYLGNILAGSLPPPPLIFPPVTFPRYVTHGIPKTQGDTSAFVSSIPPPTADSTGQDDDDISREQDKLKQQLLEVTPGSAAAEDLMDSLEEMAKNISHPKTKTTASLVGIFAKALWKDRQGIYWKVISVILSNSSPCFVGNMSRSKEKGGIGALAISVHPTPYHFRAGNFKVLIAPSELRKKALGNDTYWPFQMHGFPVGFDYPANATILGQSGARNNPIKNTISYAIINACIMGELNDDGSRSFLRFERKDWGESLSLSPVFLVLMRLRRCECVELS